MCENCIKNFKKNVVFSLVINLFFSFTLIVFGPYEIFIGNSMDYEFTFRDFWWMPVIIAVVYLVAATFLFSILTEKICNLCNRFIFSFTICCYVQAMLLNSKIKSFTGEEIVWQPKTLYSNLIIWIIIFVGVLFLPFYVKKNWKIWLQGLAAALVAMQAVALVSLFITTSALTEQKTGYVSAQNMLELSENENVIVFILDFFDGRTMDEILSEDPNFLEPLDGFTYFPNATSVHSRTYPAITYLLTENICYFDKTPGEWVNEASENSKFLPSLSQHGFDVGLYTEAPYIGNSIRGLMCNFEPDKLALDFNKTVDCLSKMILYRDMPYILKSFFEYSSSEINNDIVKEKEEDSTSEKYQWGNDEWFYQKIVNERIVVSDKKGCFRFYHMTGPHVYLTDTTVGGRRSMEIVYEYLKQMKDLGIYESSTIIITTDHAFSGGGDTLDMPQETAVPIMFVKPAGGAGNQLQVSTAPVSQTDLFPTVMREVSLSYDGKTVFDIGEDEKRERYYYYTALYSDIEGEIELREYCVDGDARDAGSYHFTGNTWDVIYSQNKVAD